MSPTFLFEAPGLNTAMALILGRSSFMCKRWKFDIPQASCMA